MTKEKRLTRNDFATRKEYDDYRARLKGYKDYEEWIDIQTNNPDEWAKRKGFKNFDEFNKIRGEGTQYEKHNRSERESKHRLGICQPYDKNMDCALWLGVNIAEKLLPELFEEPKMMPFGNEGYDAVCRLGFKIDVKSSCIINQGYSDYWFFNIVKNKKADYFIMFGFDNRKELNLIRIWLVKGEDIIRKGRMLNEFMGLSIPNTPESLKEFEKYELKDKLDKGTKICEEFKKKYRK